MKRPLEINWLVNLVCNFRCPYCFTLKVVKNAGEPDIEKVVAGFNRLARTCRIFINGGEPFLYPRFVELCSRLVKKHTIVVNTNLTGPEVYEFADTLDPRRVLCIHASIHIGEREHLGLVEDFIEKYHYFEKKGFYIFASYVLYPPFLKRLKKDYEFFKSRGIVIRPKVFRGEYRKKTYPEAYTARERALISDYMKRSVREFPYAYDRDLEDFFCVSLDARLLNGLPNFYGKPCGAGKSALCILSNGDVFRCYPKNHHFGNLFLGDEITLFKKPVPCPKKRCVCPYISLRHIPRRLQTQKRGRRK